MKKLIAIFMALAFLTAGFTGCEKDIQKSSEKLQIVSTIFPSYDFARQICGDKGEVTLLLPPGSESHSYEPTPQDIIKIQNSDLFIYVGGESDTWVNSILESMDTPVKTIKMMDCVQTFEEEIVEGMEEDVDHEHDHEDAEHEEEEHQHEEGEEHKQEPEYDEHVWTSPKNAIKITEKIAGELCIIDAENSALYQANAKSYVTQIEQLDKSFSDFFATVQNKTLIFGDRFPLRYFVEEYSLAYYAAFPGCSTDTEPSAATVAFLTDKVKSEQIGTVFYIEFSNHKVADSIAEATGAKTALFHTCHNVSKEDRNNGATYVSLMKQNLATLKEAMK